MAASFGERQSITRLTKEQHSPAASEELPTEAVHREVASSSSPCSVLGLTKSEKHDHCLTHTVLVTNSVPTDARTVGSNSSPTSPFCLCYHAMLTAAQIQVPMFPKIPAACVSTNTHKLYCAHTPEHIQLYLTSCLFFSWQSRGACRGNDIE